MNPTAPHFLLFTQANDAPSPHRSSGSWKFVLEEIGSDFRIEEGCEEPGVRGERLQLLAVIRGLEALEQPSIVTLITPSRYVGRGIRGAMAQWKANRWQWEHFGEMQTIKHVDLWQRIDAALSFHKINCRIWQFDVPHARTQSPVSNETSSTPFVSDFADAGEQEVGSNGRGRNRIRINDEVREQFFDRGLDRQSSFGNFLSEKVKPIGQGRAYGYAIN